MLRHERGITPRCWLLSWIYQWLPRLHLSYLTLIVIEPLYHTSLARSKIETPLSYAPHPEQIPILARYPQVVYAVHFGQHGSTSPHEVGRVDVARWRQDRDLFHVDDKLHTDRLEPALERMVHAGHVRAATNYENRLKVLADPIVGARAAHTVEDSDVQWELCRLVRGVVCPADGRCELDDRWRRELASWGCEGCWGVRRLKQASV
jgi:hypothetical protein